VKICLVGHHQEKPDEGVRNVTRHLLTGLAERHSVNMINIRNIREWAGIRKHSPEIIHFVLGPSSVFSIFLMKFLGLLHHRAKTILSAIQPFSPTYTKWMSWLGPDLTTVQSRTSEGLFSNAGWKTEFLPMGVDINRFAPVSGERRKMIRKQLGLSAEAFVVLHVGAINKGRNVQILSSLQGDGRQVVVVGRVNEKSEPDILENLRAAGCEVWIEYLANIEEVYACADCYVFPCYRRENSIELPLSVLEAMACDIPVVTRPLGSLPDIFEENASYRYAEDDSELISIVQTMSRKKPVGSTRQYVVGLSWECVVGRIENIYEQLLS
jgi:glycosyltransferase involved in cell wall biosynthesis